MTTDGGYDTRKCHDTIAPRKAHAIIPPRKNAKPWKPTSAGPLSHSLRMCCPAMVARNEAGNASRYLGRAIWRQWSGYHRRSRVESRMRCVKPMGQSLMAVRHCARTNGASLAHLRPAGRRNPNAHRGAQPLHRTWHTCHCARRINVSGERVRPPVS